MIPFLCDMTSKNRVNTHSDADGCYVVTIKRKVGLVAAFGVTLLSDQFWNDPTMSDDFRQSSEGVRLLQRRKARDPTVFRELRKLQELANKHSVPSERVLLVDCSQGPMTPDEVASLAREALEREVAFERIRSNALWPSVTNRVGLTLTDVLIDEAWGKTREQFCETGQL